MRSFNILTALGLIAACACLALGVNYLMPNASHLADSVGVVTAMAVVQSTYSERIAGAYAGMVGTMVPSDVDTCICETVAGIGFGLAVSQGSADNGAVLGGASAAVFRGISLRDITLVNSTADKYARYQNMGILTKGDVWVTVDGDVAAGNNVTFLSTTGALGTVAADGTHFAITGARWMTSASSGNLALLRLTGNLPSA